MPFFQSLSQIQSGSILDVANIAALKALAVAGMPDKTRASIGGYSSWGDGGGGIFFYDAGSSAADNGGTIIAPTSGSGRWKRNYSFGAVNARWFGAAMDGETDDSAAISAALSAENVVYITGNTALSQNVNVVGGKSIVGQSTKIAVSGSGSITVVGAGAGIEGLTITADSGFTGSAVKVRGYAGATPRLKPFVRRCSFYGPTGVGTAIDLTSGEGSPGFGLFCLDELLFQGWEYGIKLFADHTSGTYWVNGGVGGNFRFTGGTKYCIHISKGTSGATTECSGNTFSNIQVQTDATLVKAIYIGNDCSTNMLTNVHIWDVGELLAVDVSGVSNYIGGVIGEEATNYTIGSDSCALAIRNNGASPASLHIGSKLITQSFDAPGEALTVSGGETTVNVFGVSTILFGNASPTTVSRIYSGESVYIGRRLLLRGDGNTTLSSALQNGSGRLHSSIGTLLLASGTLYELVWLGDFWHRPA